MKDKTDIGKDVINEATVGAYFQFGILFCETVL